MKSPRAGLAVISLAVFDHALRALESHANIHGAAEGRAEMGGSPTMSSSGRSVYGPVSVPCSIRYVPSVAKAIRKLDKGTVDLGHTDHQRGSAKARAI